MEEKIDFLLESRENWYRDFFLLYLYENEDQNT